MGGKIVLQYLQHLIDHPDSVVQGLPEQACPVAGLPSMPTACLKVIKELASL